MAQLRKLQRTPIRASLTVFITVVCVLEGILAHWGMAMESTPLMALIALFGGMVTSEHLRPSGTAPRPSKFSAEVDTLTQP